MAHANRSWEIKLSSKCKFNGMTHVKELTHF